MFTEEEAYFPSLTGQWLFPGAPWPWALGDQEEYEGEQPGQEDGVGSVRLKRANIDIQDCAEMASVLFRNVT